MEPAQTSQTATSFTFAHLSDPHLTAPDAVRWSEMLNKRALGYLSWRRRQHAKGSSVVLGRLREDVLAGEPDHIAITGDLTNLGTPVEYDEAARWLTSLGDAGAVSVIPGNHDCYAPDARVSPADQWRPWLSSDEPLGVGFPFVRYRGPVAFIGVSSAAPSAPGFATGYVGYLQLQRLRELLDRVAARDYFRVILIHHPPIYSAVSWRKRLTDAGRLRSVIEDCGAGLVVHGHAHRFIQSAMMTGGGRIPVLGAPAAAATSSADGERAGYYRLCLDRADGAWRLSAEARALPLNGNEPERVAAYSCALGSWPSDESAIA